MNSFKRFFVGKIREFLIVENIFTLFIMTNNTLAPSEQSSLLALLKKRFESNMERHIDLLWTDIEARITCDDTKLFTLSQMEATWGEPDVIGYDTTTNTYLYVDCCIESPSGRRSLCYDRAALDGRRENKPKDSVIDMANSIGANLLTESEYRTLQSLGKFDLKTSSWILTPDSIRTLGGALFCDRRYDTIFTYHNGADSYYAARGWRGIIRL